MPVVNLTPAFMANKVQCPPGQKKIEFCDAQVRGLFIECLSAAASQPTWNYRYKENGKTKSRRIGPVKDIALEDARKKVALRKAQHDLAVPAPAQNAQGGLRLADFMRLHYFPHAKVHKRSWRRDEQLYRRIDPSFGHLALGEITRLKVQQFQAALLQERLSGSTVNHHIQLMRHILNLAQSWEMVERNVLARIQLLSLDNQIENNLDDEQVVRLVKVLQTDDNRLVCLILLFLLSTGARLREGLCAKWSQVDLKNGVWRIPATNTKAKKLKHLPLNPSARWALEQLGTEATSEFLFPSPVTGKPFISVTRVWYRLRKKAGLPNNVRIHDLRHTYASRLLCGGENISVVQGLLGHADPRTTMRYAHLSMATKQRAASVASLPLDT